MLATEAIEDQRQLVIQGLQEDIIYPFLGLKPATQLGIQRVIYGDRVMTESYSHGRSLQHKVSRLQRFDVDNFRDAETTY